MYTYAGRNGDLNNAGGMERTGAEVEVEQVPD